MPLTTSETHSCQPTRTRTTTTTTLLNTKGTQTQDHSNPLSMPEQEREKENPFPLPNLPPEIRHQIYIHYFRVLPPLSITTSTTVHPSPPLVVASPFFANDIPRSIYRANQIFEFSSGKGLREFAGVEGRKKEVRRVRIVYGKEKGECFKRGWVFLVLGCFEGIEEVTFVLEGRDVEGDGGIVMGTGMGIREERGVWWNAVRGAVREGLGVGRRGKKGVWVRVEDERCCVVEEMIVA